MARRDGTRRLRGMWSALCCAIVLVTAVAGAQTDRTQYFVDLLSSSTSFSVRAQAALALGRVPQSAQVRTALTAALRDNEPAVRAAAASAMERQADAQLLAPLRAAVASERDSTVLDAERRAITALEAVATAGTPRGATRGTTTTAAAASSSTAAVSGSVRPVPTGTPRYYVGIGTPGDNSSSLSATQLAELQGFLASQVGGVEGVVLAPKVGLFWDRGGSLMASLSWNGQSTDPLALEVYPTPLTSWPVPWGFWFHGLGRNPWVVGITTVIGLGVGVRG